MLYNHENINFIRYFCRLSCNFFWFNGLQTAIHADVGKNKAFISNGGSFNASKKIAFIK